MSKIKIELEAESWFAILALMTLSVEKMAPNIGNNPLTYSRAARALNSLNQEFLKNVTLDQLAEYELQRKEEKI